MPPLDPKLPQPPPGIPEWRQPQRPPGPPSILNRLGMVGLSALPIFTTVVSCWAGYAMPWRELMVAGIILGVLIIFLLIMAQISPNWRKGAMITLAIFSCVIMLGTGITIFIVAVIYASCIKGSP